MANSNYYKVECERLEKQNAQLTRIINSMAEELVFLRTIISTVEAMLGEKILTVEQTTDNIDTHKCSPGPVTAESAIASLQEASRKIDWECLLTSEEYGSMLNIGPTMNL